MESEAAMLKVDLNDSDYHIKQFITHTCSAFGRVTSVRMHRSPSPFALIEMATREQTYDLSFNFGGSTFGSCVLVHLEQTADRKQGGLRMAA